MPLCKDAVNYLGKVASKKGKVLFVGTKRAASDAVREEAQRCGMPFVNHRWLGGMLTNFRTVRASIKRLKELEEMAQSNTYEKINKKEILQLSREQEKLDKTLGGIKDMGGLPDVLFVVDVGYENIAVLEASKLGIPIVGIVDTNNSPDNIDYIVPGNDDSMRAIRLYTKMVADAILVGKESIVVSVNEGDEMIELDSDGASVAAPASVKISTRKSAKPTREAVVAEDSVGTVDATKLAEAEESVEAVEAGDTATTEEAVETGDTATTAEVVEAVDTVDTLKTEAAEEAVEKDKSASEPAQEQEPEPVAETAVVPAKTAAPKKAVIEKVESSKKAPTKKETTSKPVTKKAEASKSVSKKAAPKKATPKKAVAKKAAPKKAAPKKAAVKKAATKKAVSKKAAAKKAES
jgi:small subunit ribosomal protein S2